MNCFQYRSVLLFALISLIFNITSAQDSPEIYSSYVSSIDSIYGTDDILVNGGLYFPTHPLAQGNPYLTKTDWTKGIIFSKGKSFKDVDLQYDLTMDKIVLQKTLNNGKLVKIVLNNELVDSFAFDQKKFVNARWILLDNSVKGFVELIYDKEIRFFVKYHKEYISQFTDSNPYGKYSKVKSARYIYNNNILTKVSNKKSLLKYFELYKKEIKKYLRKNHINYKKANSRQLFDLIDHCNELSSK